MHWWFQLRLISTNGPTSPIIRTDTYGIMDSAESIQLCLKLPRYPVFSTDQREYIDRQNTITPTNDLEKVFTVWLNQSCTRCPFRDFQKLEKKSDKGLQIYSEILWHGQNVHLYLLTTAFWSSFPKRKVSSKTLGETKYLGAWSAAWWLHRMRTCPDHCPASARRILPGSICIDLACYSNLLIVAGMASD